jgi:ABC-type tungstate transport system substrate-binding protein
LGKSGAPLLAVFARSICCIGKQNLLGGGVIASRTRATPAAIAEVARRLLRNIEKSIHFFHRNALRAI